MQEWRKEQWRKIAVRMHYKAEFTFEEIEHLLRIVDWAARIIEIKSKEEYKQTVEVLTRLLNNEKYDSICTEMFPDVSKTGD